MRAQCWVGAIELNEKVRVRGPLRWVGVALPGSHSGRCSRGEGGSRHNSEFNLIVNTVVAATSEVQHHSLVRIQIMESRINVLVRVACGQRDLGAIHE